MVLSAINRFKNNPEDDEFKMIIGGCKTNKEGTSIESLSDGLQVANNLFKDANKVLNGDKVTIKLAVKKIDKGVITFKITQEEVEANEPNNPKS